MNDWLAILPRADTVLVELADCHGSTPRDAGAGMVVCARHVQGSIGGGEVERCAIAVARRRLQDGVRERQVLAVEVGAAACSRARGRITVVFEPGDAPWLTPLREALATGHEAQLIRHRHDPRWAVCGDSTTSGDRDLATALSSGRCDVIGGADEYLVETVSPRVREIVLVGAGHVGQALVRAIGETSCRIRWIDQRHDAFPETLPASVTALCTCNVEHEVARAPARAAWVLATGCLELELELAERVLRQGGCRFFGIVGSRGKGARIEQRLLERGLTPAQLAPLACPVGIAGIADKHPAAIAISIAAQLLSLPV